MSEQARGVRRFVERTAPVRAAQPDGHVIAAGKGGIGTSTVALLLAFAARTHGPVVLVDAQGGFGGLHQLLGLAPWHDEEDRVRETPLGPDLTLIHAPAHAKAESPGLRAAMRRAVRARTDAIVLVDAGSRPQTVLHAMHDFGASLVSVVGADGISPAAAYGLAKLIWRTRPEASVAALANRVTDDEAGVAQDALRSAARRFAGRGIVWLGQLPEAPALLDADGPPWATIDSTEPALMAGADSVATRLLGPTPHRNSTLHRFG